MSRLSSFPLSSLALTRSKGMLSLLRASITAVRRVALGIKGAVKVSPVEA